MDLILERNSFHYEMEKLCRLFYPMQRIRVFENGETPPDPEPLTVVVGVRAQEGATCLYARVTQQNTTDTVEQRYDGPDIERALAVLLYGLLEKSSGFTPQWGILTGIRPVKLLRSLVAGCGESQALRDFQADYLVSSQKTKLAQVTMHNEQQLLDHERPDGFSLYVGIPFCPSRCAYCSFVSTTVERTMGLIPDYLDGLCAELRATAAVARDLGLVLQSVYIGGGTPTTLTVAQLDRLLGEIGRSFDLTHCMEYTVEAGRPDTVDLEKCAVLRQHGVTRISINPQTMDDAVLEAIGRRHTVQQTLTAYQQARDAGFTDINMDLIAGLPGDTLAGFQKTVDQVMALDPESITVHTLALKRASRIYQEDQARADGATAAAMLDYADNRLLNAQYRPYYLYRQSRILGGLENVGFAKAGSESFYNTVIMDETQTILACGAGAGTKVVDPAGSGQLKRIYNFKYPYEYIHRHSEVLARKDKVRAIYAGFSKRSVLPRTQ